MQGDAGGRVLDGVVQGTDGVVEEDQEVVD
jgi:hypothetical protein